LYQWFPWFASYQGNMFSYPDGQLSSRIKLISNIISNSHSRFLKNGGCLVAQGKDWSRKGARGWRGQF
jgi:hypothetical protein